MRIATSLFITAAVLAGLWLMLKPQSNSPAETTAAVSQTENETAAVEAEPFVLELSSGVVNGPDTLKVRQGDAVDIQITSDKAEEAHLHGYDLHAELQPGIPAHLLFTANKSGRFELELHGSHRTIGVLEVYPNP